MLKLLRHESRIGPEQKYVSLGDHVLVYTSSLHVSSSMPLPLNKMHHKPSLCVQVGTEDKPFEHKGIITLHGHVRSIEIPIYGAKGIGIREGTLDLHGQHIPITWTILAQTAEADQNTIVVKHPVTWKASDRIAIASTGKVGLFVRR